MEDVLTRYAPNWGLCEPHSRSKTQKNTKRLPMPAIETHFLGRPARISSHYTDKVIAVVIKTLDCCLVVWQRCITD